ncbi:unnamed protein product [Arabidopsis halleri]
MLDTFSTPKWCNASAPFNLIGTCKQRHATLYMLDTTNVGSGNSSSHMMQTPD